VLVQRHCERSEAIHHATSGGMDRFVASPPLHKRFAFVAGNHGIYLPTKLANKKSCAIVSRSPYVVSLCR
jgi:protein-tyrosine-phosphatase